MSALALISAGLILVLWGVAFALVWGRRVDGDGAILLLFVTVVLTGIFFGWVRP